ncbi:MAG TPA: FHA domain-containing protein [Archangium sp.]|jgi:pSer/pThr/pTyr-binding forkhead associated (FHA) protein
MRLVVNPRPATDVKVPAIIWEAPPNEATTDSGHWEMTDAGGSLTRPRTGEPLVFLVEKGANTQNNPFAMGITIGRVESNDIVLDDGSVSRFHAWLQLDERTQLWSLTDAESKNGTWVDGTQLAPKTRVALKDGARIKLGDVELQFCLPPTLKAFVTERFNRAP